MSALHHTLFIVGTVAISCLTAEIATSLPLLSIQGNAPTAGAATLHKPASPNAFAQPASNLSFEERMPFNLGHSLFKKLWVSSPSSTTASDGLGPLFNARSCMRCHVRDGRGHPPDVGQLKPATSTVIHLSIAPQNELQETLLAQGKLGVIPEPAYGNQLQDMSIQGLPAEGRIALEYDEHTVTLADGEQVSLRKPRITITDLSYGPFHPDTMMSMRVAPAMVGLGLLEAISEADLLANEDPEDLNQDGISGHANRVWDYKTQQTAIGRFGWKAGHPTIEQQNSMALRNDIGISNTLFPAGFADCTEAQSLCQSLPDGNSQHLDGVEASDDMVKMLTFYTQHLAVPDKRNRHSGSVKRGEQLFSRIGCSQCHIPSYQTRSDTVASLADQTIWPYTDLLLHDMGEGLADHRPEYQANGREWRTPALWGIGLTQMVSGHTQFLHDGRARNLQEAILWHGGEADAARQHYSQLTANERKDLIQFLESL